MLMIHITQFPGSTLAAGTGRQNAGLQPFVEASHLKGCYDKGFHHDLGKFMAKLMEVITPISWDILGGLRGYLNVYT